VHDRDPHPMVDAMTDPDAKRIMWNIAAAYALRARHAEACKRRKISD
jgi:hypothetical protein